MAKETEELKELTPEELAKLDANSGIVDEEVPVTNVAEDNTNEDKTEESEKKESEK
jgi:hypothetical protein